MIGMKRLLGHDVWDAPACRSPLVSPNSACTASACRSRGRRWPDQGGDRPALVRKGGLEPPRLAALEPISSADWPPSLVPPQLWPIQCAKSDGSCLPRRKYITGPMQFLRQMNSSQVDSACPCRCGGIGRRKRFRSVRLWRAGSSPVTGTTGSLPNRTSARNLPDSVSYFQNAPARLPASRNNGVLAKHDELRVSRCF